MRTTEAVEITECSRRERKGGSAMTVCRDCGGPIAQAFATTANYDRCTRCGHVFPAVSAAGTTEEE